jgi:hypothetical protein
VTSPADRTIGGRMGVAESCTAEPCTAEPCTAEPCTAEPWEESERDRERHGARHGARQGGARVLRSAGIRGNSALERSQLARHSQTTNGRLRAVGQATMRGPGRAHGLPGGVAGQSPILSSDVPLSDTAGGASVPAGG